jgi:hypothetical protein
MNHFINVIVGLLFVGALKKYANSLVGFINAHDQIKSALIDFFAGSRWFSCVTSLG